MKTLNVALIGYGLSGKIFHYPLITVHPGFKLSYIYSSRVETSKELKEMNTDCLVTQNIEDIFSSPVDLVVITSPNKLHHALAKRALESHKHVLVEKPFTITSEEALDLVRLSEEKRLICTVFHNRRWDGDYKTVRKIIQSGKLGNLREYEAHFDRFRNYQKPGSWKEKGSEPGSGILYDLGPHLIDQALYLFGMPQEIYADIRSQRQRVEIDDNFELLLYYPELKVTLKAGMLVKEPLPKFILLGDQGSFVKYGTDVQEGQSRSGMTPENSGWGIEKPENWGIINSLNQDGEVREAVPTERGDYTSFYQQLYDSILKEYVQSPSAIDGYNVIKIIEYALESNRSGRRLSVK